MVVEMDDRGRGEKCRDLKRVGFNVQVNPVLGAGPI